MGAKLSTIPVLAFLKEMAAKYSALSCSFLLQQNDFSYTVKFCTDPAFEKLHHGKHTW